MAADASRTSTKKAQEEYSQLAYEVLGEFHLILHVKWIQTTKQIKRIEDNSAREVAQSKQRLDNERTAVENLKKKVQELQTTATKLRVTTKGLEKVQIFERLVTWKKAPMQREGY